VNWDAVGAIAEALGALAVIATLVYVARQISQNTVTVRSSALSAYSQVTSDLVGLLAQDAGVNRLFWCFLQATEALSEEDERRAHSLVGMYLNAMEHAYDLFHEGVLSEEKWAGRRAQLAWFVGHPGFSRYWDAYGPTYPRGFAAAVEAEFPGSRAPV
jgi:hypothetical protein